MRLKAYVPLLAVGAGLLAFAAPAEAQVKVKLEPYVTGVNSPLVMTSPPGDARKFVVEQWGRIRIIDADGKLQGEPFLDIRDKIVVQWGDFDERGMLGLAFHPDYANNGKFYIAYSAPTVFQADLAKLFWWDHTNVIAEYTVSKDDPDKADRESERRISSIDWPQFNHNGHWIGFGGDGMLYFSTGDGGYANDWGIGHDPAAGNGQTKDDPHGKIWRIDVNTAGAQAEQYAMGLRNPWRCSFDMADGKSLYCGDVQQNSIEEVNLIEQGDNLGWRTMEADQCFDYLKPDAHPPGCDQTGLKLPIMHYDNCTARRASAKASRSPVATSIVAPTRIGMASTSSATGRSPSQPATARSSSARSPATRGRSKPRTPAWRRTRTSSPSGRTTMARSMR